MKEICIRRACEADLCELRRIYDAAKSYMRQTGNPTQWSGGYPQTELLLEDIAAGRLYVIGDDRGLAAVFALIPGVDPTYMKIDGAWKNNRPYAAIHRVASDGRLRGVVSKAVAYAREKFPELDIKIDTHEDNKVMQGVLTREGFEYCGIIYLENGDPRLAYQLEVKNG